MRRAVFLDRDGVLVEDTNVLTEPEQLRLVSGVPTALKQLKQAGFFLVVVSNQAVVARGLATEAKVQQINHCMDAMLQAAGAPALDAIYFCPHHPQATMESYRINCECRKPRPGLLLRAAQELSLDLSASFLVGDRITDVIAGARAGCRTVLVESSQSAAPPIETVEPLDVSVAPDHICADLSDAARWILGCQ